MSLMGKNNGMPTGQLSGLEQYVRGGDLESLNGQDTNLPTRCLSLTPLIGLSDLITVLEKKSLEYVILISRSLAYFPGVASHIMLNKEICEFISKTSTAYWKLNLPNGKIALLVRV